jgi:hypothetical protein
MPYFSFSLKQNFLIKNDILHDSSEIFSNKIYFSKNTSLWKILNKKTNQQYLNFINFEQRIRVKNKKESILFCLPPSAGFGDVIEYALAIKEIYLSNKHLNFGVAFTGRYVSFLKKYFNFNKVYGDIIDQKEMFKFDNIFHFSLEITELKLQKYIRSDIESVILKYFNIVKSLQPLRVYKKEIKEIYIYPVSQSPIRSIQPYIIDSIIKSFSKDYKINIVFSESPISNFIETNIKSKNYQKILPNSLDELCDLIKETDFGIFTDSGPLHFAKSIGIKGVLLTTTVGAITLLNGYKSINEITNFYNSDYCNAPCGLTNLINFKNRIGCYDSLKISKKDVIGEDNLNSLQRGSIKDKYIDFMIKPVGCIKSIDKNKVINEIKKNIKIK